MSDGNCGNLVAAGAGEDIFGFRDTDERDKGGVTK